MDTAIEREATEELRYEKPTLFAVWLDLHFGWDEHPDWEMNSHPKPLGAALDEAADARAQGWVAIVMPEGQTPRADGRFSELDDRHDRLR